MINIHGNNSAVNSAAYSYGIKDSSGAFNLGADGGNNLLGSLDEVAYWRRILTSDERTRLYNNGVGRTYDTINPNALTPTQIQINTPTFTPTMGLGTSKVLYWSFNKVSGTIPDDSCHPSHGEPMALPPSHMGKPGSDEHGANKGQEDTGTSVSLILR
jgi:hypothetical protein